MNSFLQALTALIPLPVHPKTYPQLPLFAENLVCLKDKASLASYRYDRTTLTSRIAVNAFSIDKDLVRRNFGVSVLPQSACLDELKKGKISALPIENFSMMREINIVYNSDFEKFDLLRDIISTYKDTVKTYS